MKYIAPLLFLLLIGCTTNYDDIEVCICRNVKTTTVSGVKKVEYEEWKEYNCNKQTVDFHTIFHNGTETLIEFECK